MNEAPLSGTQKAAILMALIGEEAAGNVLRHLDPAEIRQVAQEIARIRMIDASAYAGVLREFVELIASARGLEPAGPRLARMLWQFPCPKHRDCPDNAPRASAHEPRRTRGV